MFGLASSLPFDPVAEQNRIAGLVRLAPLDDTPTFVVGVDAAYVGTDGDTAAPGGGIGIGAAVVIDTANLKVVEAVTVRVEVSVGYEPGLLAFREAPVVLAAIDRLKHSPKFVACDGHGIAHPHRAGLASHVGVELGVPTLGCAKQLFVGEHGSVGNERGSTTPIIDDGELLGAVVRTQTGVNPVFVSPGHLIDVDSSVDLVLTLAGKYRLPETTRAADQLVRQEAKIVAAQYSQGDKSDGR